MRYFYVYNAYISVSLLLLEYSNGMSWWWNCNSMFHFECLFIAAFELLPTGEVFVCPGLNHLEVVCRSDESSFLLWNLTIPALNYTDTRIISSSNMVGTVTSLIVENNVMVEFMIISQPPDPLASRISVNLITPILNGSIIMCAERGTSMDRSSEIVLHVLNTNAGLSAHMHNIILIIL